MHANCNLLGMMSSLNEVYFRLFFCIFRTMTHGLEVLHRLCTEGIFPQIIITILWCLNFHEFALTCLMYEMIYPNDRPLHTWLKGQPKSKSLGSAIYRLKKNSWQPALTNQRLFTSKILDEYTGKRFYDFCCELKRTYSSEFVFNMTDNGRFSTYKEWGLVDRLLYPITGLVFGRSQNGDFEFGVFNYNPIFDYLAVTAKDHRSFTMAIFAYGKTKNEGPKLRYHFTECKSDCQWLSINWSQDGRYLFAVSYVCGKCIPYVFYLNDNDNIVKLDTTCVPVGNGNNQTVNTWCSRLGGFLWSAFEYLLFVRIDGKAGTFCINTLKGPTNIIKSILSSEKFVIMANSSKVSSKSRVGWIRTCEEDHGLRCNLPHNNFHWTGFDRKQVYNSDNNSCTLTTNGRFLDLAYDDATQRILFCILPLAGCRIGDAKNPCYLKGSTNSLECVARNEPKFVCQHKANSRRFFMHSADDLSEDERVLLIGELQTTSKTFPEFFKYTCNKVKLDLNQFKGFERLSNDFTWSTSIIACFTDDIIIVTSRLHNCEITVFRKHKCTSIRPFHSVEGPYLRHRSKPYYIKKKWWLSQHSTIEIRFLVESSNYILTEEYPANELESEYTELKVLKYLESE